MKRQSSVVQTYPVIPGNVQIKISRSWNNQMPNSQYSLVSLQSQSLSPKIGPDFVNSCVVLDNGCSNDNMPTAMSTSVSPKVSFAHTSKGQLRYNRHETLSCLENFCSITPLSTLTVACMDEKKAKEEAALAARAREESENKAKILITPKSDVRSPKRPIVSRLSTHEDLMLEVKEKLEDKHREYLAHDKQLREKIEREFQQSMQELNEHTKRNFEMLRERQDADAVEVERRQQELRTAHEQHAKILAAKMHQADQEARQIEEQRKLDLQQKRVLAVLKEQENVKSCAEEFGRLLSSCQYPQHLSSQNIQNYSDLLNHINDKISNYLTMAQSGDNFDTEKVRQYAEQAKRVLASFVPFVEEANKKGEKEMKIRQEEDEKKREAEKRSQQAPKNPELQRQQLPPSSGQGVPTQAGHNSSSDPALMADVLASYLALQETRKAAEQNCSALVNDSKLKQYRFDLQIAINTSLNSISTESGSHLQEKIVRLNRLLSDEAVEVSSGRKVSTRGHTSGAIFARDLLAKQLVKNGDTVASSPESAFAIASVGVAVWCEHKEVGDLILAYFHLKCPYTVPYYIPKGQESSEDYFKSLGYTYEDRKIEEQDKFLKRMSGYIILYAAIMVSSPLNPRHSHPHGLERAWQWLSCVVNYDPRPDITATVLFNFLDVAGHSLMNCYGRQFWKLLRLIGDDYMPRIVEAKGASGPVTRLQGFLNEALRTGRIREPKGFLKPGFWRT